MKVTKTSDIIIIIYAIMNICYELSITRCSILQTLTSFSDTCENIETVIDTRLCLFATFLPLDIFTWPFHHFLNSLLWQLETNLFREKVFEFNSLLTEFIFKRRKRIKKKKKRKKIRKENIEYWIFDIHANKSNWYKYHLT